MKNVSVVFTCDDNYASHLGVCITSILKNANHDTFYEFIVLDGGISKENKVKINLLHSINKSFSIRYFDMHNRFREMDSGARNAAAIFYRFAIPEILSEYSKVLYLDVDMIVAKDLAEIYEFDIGGKYLGAVKDGGVAGFDDNTLDAISKLIIRSKEQLRNYYFNAGFILMNLDKMRQDGIMQKAKEFAIKHRGNLPFFDQDALNYATDWNIVYLPEKYNCFAIKKNRYKKDIAVLHYISNKPWNSDQVPLAYLYWHYRQISPWRISIISFLIKRLRMICFRNRFLKRIVLLVNKDFLN